MKQLTLLQFLSLLSRAESCDWISSFPLIIHSTTFTSHKDGNRLHQRLAWNVQFKSFLLRIGSILLFLSLASIRKIIWVKVYDSRAEFTAQKASLNKSLATSLVNSFRPWREIWKSIYRNLSSSNIPFHLSDLLHTASFPKSLEKESLDWWKHSRSSEIYYQLFRFAVARIISYPIAQHSALLK